jgi:hypothetical protein
VAAGPWPHLQQAAVAELAHPAVRLLQRLVHLQAADVRGAGRARSRGAGCWHGGHVAQRLLVLRLLLLLRLLLRCLLLGGVELHHGWLWLGHGQLGL